VISIAVALEANVRLPEIVSCGFFPPLEIQETMLVLKESMPVPRPPQVLHLLYARVYFLCPEAPVEPKHLLIQCSTTWVEGAPPLLPALLQRRSPGREGAGQRHRRPALGRHLTVPSLLDQRAARVQTQGERGGLVVTPLLPRLPHSTMRPWPRRRRPQPICVRACELEGSCCRSSR